MGDGERLKRIIDSKGTNVRQVGINTGISPTTLYSIIKNDSNIRLDFAIKLADALMVDVEEISGTSDKLHERYGSALKDNDKWMERHLRNVTGKIISKFNEEDMVNVDTLLRSFYMLSDRGRDDMLKIIKVIADNNKDNDRENSY